METYSNSNFRENKGSRNPSTSTNKNSNSSIINDLKDAAANIFQTNSENSAEMAANMIVGSTAINYTVDSMAKGAQYLDDIWKGDTKETFMEELSELNNLIKENADTLKELGNEIEQQNRINEKLHHDSTIDAINIYFGDSSK